jgi:hypothetical protein
MINQFLIRLPKVRLKKTGIITLRASRSGRICFVAKGSQHREYSFILHVSHLQPPRLVNMPG